MHHIFKRTLRAAQSTLNRIPLTSAITSRLTATSSIPLRRTFLLAAPLSTAITMSSADPASTSEPGAPAAASSVAPSSFFDLSAFNIKKKPVDFSEYKGKVVLVVNVASKCGFTPQYAGLEKIWQEYKDKGFVILAFPCNGFGSQEPGDEPQIEEFCRANYGVSFPVMKKIEVNGDNEHEVYKFLKGQKAGLLGMRRIKWNFEKFLVDKDGQVFERYSSLTKPESLKADIEKLLNAPATA